MNTKEIIQHQIKLLKKEKEEDYRQYQERMTLSSLEERASKGITWFPVNLTKDFISTGERITLELEKTKRPDQKHGFQVGSIVGVFPGFDEKRSVNGVVSYLKEPVMRIVMNQTNLPDWLFEEKIGVNLLFDDSTYREMNRALIKTLDARNNRLAHLRDVLYGEKAAAFNRIHSYEVPSLNKKQNEAFETILHAEDVAFVHGPPGTGKTTTLTKCIKETVSVEKQVLVCAPSNAAIDLIVEKLVDEGLDVLRLGHPARLTPEVVENSMDVRISKHQDYIRLKELRKQSEECRKLAGKYKRNFGRQEKAQRELLMQESKSLKRASKDLEKYIIGSLVDHAQVIASTLTGSSNTLISDRMFKTVFIDESSQAIEAASWIPLDRVQRVIMSGDHHQLPPTIKSIEAAKDGLETTLFSRGVKNQPSARVMLETQYRMHPSIMGFSSNYFYDGRLGPSDSVLNRAPENFVPLTFIDTSGAGFEEELKAETLSTFNIGEAESLLRLMSQEPLEGHSVGIIAPYKAQVQLLERRVNESADLAPFRMNISVNTVDAFQGQERDFIYISLVRSNSQSEIGFLKEYRRMNVAMTRAKVRLVVIGDSSTLGNDDFFSDFVNYVQQEGEYRSIYEYEYLIS